MRGSSQRVPDRGFKVTKCADPMPCSVSRRTRALPMLWAKWSHVRSSTTLTWVWPSSALQNSPENLKARQLLSSGEKNKYIYTHTQAESESENDGRTMAQQADTLLKSWAGLLLSRQVNCEKPNKHCSLLCFGLLALPTLNASKCLK